MTQEHPMIPPRELVDRLQDLGNLDAIELAYQAGADQELEACVNYVDNTISGNKARALRAARRPKPPSLKELALAELELLRGDANAHGLGFDAPAIRQALELLND